MRWLNCSELGALIGVVGVELRPDPDDVPALATNCPPTATPFCPLPAPFRPVAGMEPKREKIWDFGTNF